MRIIVYGLTKQRAYNKLEELLSNIKYGDILKVMKSSMEFKVLLKNGNTYQAVVASDSARGHKWGYAIIDSLIDKKLVDTVIFPCFTKTDIFDFKESYSFY